MTHDLGTLLADRPKFHGGRTMDMGIHPDLAAFLDSTLQAGYVTLETGCGLSTLVMLRAGVSRHIAVCPIADEFEAIGEQCAARGIKTTALEIAAHKSEDYLPTATLPQLDLVLIDGAHAFPFPFLDWHFTADRLKVGGFMVVDDTNIAACLFLADFMSADPKWREILRHPRFSVHQKVIHPIHDGNWPAQPYLWDTYPTATIRINRGKSITEPRMPGAFERAMARVLPWRLVQKPLLSWFNWPRRS